MFLAANVLHHFLCGEEVGRRSYSLFVGVPVAPTPVSAATMFSTAAATVSASSTAAPLTVSAAAASASSTATPLSVSAAAAPLPVMTAAALSPTEHGAAKVREQMKYIKLLYSAEEEQHEEDKEEVHCEQVKLQTFPSVQR